MGDQQGWKGVPQDRIQAGRLFSSGVWFEPGSGTAAQQQTSGEEDRDPGTALRLLEWLVGREAYGAVRAEFQRSFADCRRREAGLC